MKSTVTRSIPDLFSPETEGDVTTLKFRQREFVGIDLALMQGLWSFLDQQQEHPSKVLVFEIPRGLLSPSNVDALLASRTDSDRKEGLWQVFENLRREENTQIQIVDRIVNLESFTVAVVQGEIDLALLGPVLSCDYQIASDDTVIVNRLLKAGVPSIGETMWFLVSRLGSSTARRFVWSGENITCAQAHTHGLFSEVAPALELEARTREVAEWFSSKSRNRLRALKTLLSAADNSSEAYRFKEQREINRCLGDLAQTV